MKLTYFNIKARAEPIRLALTIGGVPFEDERLVGDQWPVLKQSGVSPFRQLPILTLDDGTVLGQSTAILRYAGSIGTPRLYPADPKKAAAVDAIISQVQDFESAMKPSGAEQDAEKKLQMRAQLANEVFPPMLKDLDNFIKKHFQGYATGSEITVADLFLYQMNTSYSSGAYDGIPATVLQGYEYIQKVVQAVKSHPKVQEWESKH
ncbi:glutathione S-transferase [Gorgonomyces haynaldii]|nr:glutathione S-transferase [Gorgonomyces haynaldii]